MSSPTIAEIRKPPLRIKLCFFDKGFFTPAVMQYEPHLHAQYEIHIVESGGYELEELKSDKKTMLKAGMVAVIPPNCSHNTVLNTKISSVKANVSRCVIRMDFEKIKNEILCQIRKDMAFLFFV